MAKEESEFICSVRESIINTGKTLLNARQTDGIIVLKADDTEDLVVVIHDVDDNSTDFAGSGGHAVVDPDAVERMCSMQIQMAAKLKGITKYCLETDGIIVFKGDQLKQIIVKIHEVIGNKQAKDINKSDKSISKTNKKREGTEVQQHLKQSESKQFTLPSNINQKDQKMRTLPSNESKDAKVKNKMILQPPEVKKRQNAPLDITQDSSKRLRVENKEILLGSSAMKHQQNTPKKTPLDDNASKTVEVENKMMLPHHTAAQYQQKLPVKDVHSNIITKPCKDEVGQAVITRPSSDTSPLKSEALSIKNGANKSQTLPTTSECTAESPRKSKDGKESHELFNLNSLGIEYYASKKLEICKRTNIPCEKCSNVCETILLLEVHHTIAHQLSTCLVCAKTVANKSNLARHIQCLHLEPGLECQLCKKKFHEMYALRRHLVTHANKLKQKSTKISGASAKGAFVKNKTKTYPKGLMRKCCGKIFVDGLKYKSHMFSHKGVSSMLFLCFFCEDKFPDFSQFSLHQQRTHSQKLERQHSGNSSSYTKPSNNLNKVGKVIGQTDTSSKKNMHGQKPPNTAAAGTNHDFSKIHPIYTQETQYQEIKDNKINASDNGNKKIKLNDDYDAQYDARTNLDGDDETVTCGHCMVSFMSSKYLEVHLKRHPDHKL